MTEAGPLLYVLLVALLLMFWRKVRGLSLDALLEQGRHEHRHVLEVIAKHPHGGTWMEHRKWMREES
jgi:hypothetical protein